MKKTIILMVLSFALIGLTGCTSTTPISNVTAEDITKEDKVVNEQEVVDYFNNSLKQVKDSNDKDIIKNIVVTVVDFIFYDGEINGTKFSDLKYETRLQIVNITKDIDSAIVKKWPTYKEDISSTTNKAINDLTNQLDILSNRIQQQIDENIPQETQDIVSDKADELKDNGSKVLDEVKDIYCTAKEKIKAWYEKYRG